MFFCRATRDPSCHIEGPGCDSMVYKQSYCSPWSYSLGLQSYLLRRYLDSLNPPQSHLLRRYDWSPRDLELQPFRAHVRSQLKTELARLVEGRLHWPTVFQSVNQLHGQNAADSFISWPCDSILVNESSCLFLLAFVFICAVLCWIHVALEGEPQDHQHRCCWSLK